MNQAATVAAPIGGMPITPAIGQDTQGVRPTELRYGWCAFGDIPLINGDGTVAHFVQPPEIQAADGSVLPNPNHRVLRKNQLIPFPTFSHPVQAPDPDLRNAAGRPLVITSMVTVPALDATNRISRDYSEWGFIVLKTLQGMDQEQAYRIFRIVMPLDYKAAELPYELTSGAEERIASTQAIGFEAIPGYVVEPLRNDTEREIARRLATEMAEGADRAVARMNDIFDETAGQIQARGSGASQGKTTPDPLDQRISRELGKTFPTLVGPSDSAVAMNAKIDMLVDHAKTQKMKDELEEMRAELAQYRSQAAAPAPAPVPEPEPEPTEPEPQTSQPINTPAKGQICGFIKDNGEPCRTPTNGSRCAHHKDQ